MNLFTFHRLKYQLYEIIGRSLSNLRQARHCFSDADKLGLLIKTVRDTESALTEWRQRLPPFFDHSTWSSDDPLDLQHSRSTHWYDEARTLTLQSMTLQIIFDSIVITLHRPVLEIGFGRMKHVRCGLKKEDISVSMQAAVEAAFRISRVSLSTYEKELSSAYILMACLTAAVILCLPPVLEPMTMRAHQAKEGLLRIIYACKNLRGKVLLAEHMHQLLLSLLKKVVEREAAEAVDKCDEGPPSATAGLEQRTLSTEPNFDSRSRGVTNTISEPVYHAPVSSAAVAGSPSFNQAQTRDMEMPSTESERLIARDPNLDFFDLIAMENYLSWAWLDAA